MDRKPWLPPHPLCTLAGHLLQKRQAEGLTGLEVAMPTLNLHWNPASSKPQLLAFNPPAPTSPTCAGPESEGQLSRILPCVRGYLRSAF